MTVGNQSTQGRGGESTFPQGLLESEEFYKCELAVILLVTIIPISQVSPPRPGKSMHVTEVTQEVNGRVRIQPLAQKPVSWWPCGRQSRNVIDNAGFASGLGPSSATDEALDHEHVIYIAPQSLRVLIYKIGSSDNEQNGEVINVTL